jgi:hypothetical protein
LIRFSPSGEALRIQSGYFGIENDAWIDELLTAPVWLTKPMPTCASCRWHEAESRN